MKSIDPGSFSVVCVFVCKSDNLLVQKSTFPIKLFTNKWLKIINKIYNVLLGTKTPLYARLAIIY